MMCELLVEGGERLYGELTIQGSKNSVLPILAATLLCADTCVIENCPKLRDVDASVAILRHLGCCTHWEDSALVVDTARMDRAVVPDALMREMRSSVIFLGAILARCKEATICYPGGCELGPRPIDLHLSALSALGAEIRETGGELKCRGGTLLGSDVYLPMPSVGATENALLCACGADGVTTIYNAAREPEIVDLQNFINAMGGNVRGAGGSIITVEGRRALHGGKYRIIDFPLSNCTNSGIDTVGVLTQYRPMELNSYIGSGQPWDLDSSSGGVHILPPYMGSKGGTWYKGTANAIYQNIGFLDLYDPEYVVILSGDHIYKMDYNKMLRQHKETGVDATIAVLDVPLSEASRFGIMNCRPDGTIYEFEEKPKEPKSTLASMGIYIFSWKKLRKYLEEDEANSKSSNDFGKDIIPAMLANGEKMVSYRFEGYWKDVGTIESLWEANMDLLSPNSGLNLSDDSWKIYGRTTGSPPHFTAKGAKVQHTLLSEGCEIAGNVSESVLFSDVKVAKNANVEYSILMPGAVVEEGANVRYAIVASGAVIAKGASIGAGPSECDVDKWGVAVVAENVRIGENVKLAAKEMADEDIPDAE